MKLWPSKSQQRTAREKRVNFFLDKQFSSMVERINSRQEMEMSQLSKFKFSGGYYFGWFYYAGVYLPPGS
jgi:hypothetical protein